MDIASSSSGPLGYITQRGAVGMKVAQQVQESQAQVVSAALEGAKQIAATPPAAAAAGRVDITV